MYGVAVVVNPVSSGTLGHSTFFAPSELKLCSAPSAPPLDRQEKTYERGTLDCSCEQEKEYKIDGRDWEKSPSCWFMIPPLVLHLRLEKIHHKRSVITNATRSMWQTVINFHFLICWLKCVIQPKLYHYLTSICLQCQTQRVIWAWLTHLLQKDTFSGETRGHSLYITLMDWFIYCSESRQGH